MVIRPHCWRAPLGTLMLSLTLLPTIFRCSNCPLVQAFTPRITTAPSSSSSSSSSSSYLPRRPLEVPSRSSTILQESKSPIIEKITNNPTQSILFSLTQTTAGALLGPFLDSYHSAFGVLQYDQPFSAQLWSTSAIPALTTTWWVPPLFGLAGFIIGWLYILLDVVFQEGGDSTPRGVTGPIILVGISFFTLQYWLSGILYAHGVDRTVIFAIMSLAAYAGYQGLDATKSGLITSLATAIGGPLIEVGLITFLAGTNGGYHYSDAGETGFFPLWILPVYFLGGPANGNLSRGTWNALGSLLNSENQGQQQQQPPSQQKGCPSCKDTRVVPCPNCDGVGYYMTYGREIKCNCCKGRGLVICRTCFSWYDEDPADIESIREFMSRLPD